jgi:hypothetical protein
VVIQKLRQHAAVLPLCKIHRYCKKPLAKIHKLPDPPRKTATTNKSQRLNTFTTKTKKLSARKSAPTHEERPETLERQRPSFSQIAKYVRDLKRPQNVHHPRPRRREREEVASQRTGGKRHSKHYYPIAVQRTVKTENPNESTPLGGRRWDRNFLPFFELLISQMLLLGTSGFLLLFFFFFFFNFLKNNFVGFKSLADFLLFFSNLQK